MNKLNNPFSPGAGSPPPELAGRENLIERASVALGRIKIGRPEKSFILVGLRGVGKTVLLNKVVNLAKDQVYETIFIEAHENKTLSEMLVPPIRNVLYRLDSLQNISHKVKRSLRVLSSFVSALKFTYKDIDFSIGALDPEKGSADSGDLEYDLPNLIESLAEAAQDRGTSIAIIIDEIQYLKEKELSSLIMSAHRISQRQLPLIFIGAGLPQLLALAGDSKSYSERLFDYPIVGALSVAESKNALQNPVKSQGVHFTDEALNEIISQTKGYPYFLQEWGYQSWNLAEDKVIDLETVRLATKESIKRLDESFFRVRLDRLTQREKEYLHVLAKMGPGQHKSGEIAAKLGRKTQQIATLRDGLIKKGMIFSPSYGDTEFTVPLFDEFMKRAMNPSN